MNHQIRTSTKSLGKHPLSRLLSSAEREEKVTTMSSRQSAREKQDGETVPQRQSFASTSVLTCSRTLEIGSPASSTSCLIGPASWPLFKLRKIEFQQEKILEGQKEIIAKYSLKVIHRKRKEIRKLKYVYPAKYILLCMMDTPMELPQDCSEK